MPEIVIIGTKGFSQHQQPLLDYYGPRILVESDYRPAAVAAHRPDLVISFEASNCQRGLVIAELARQGIATLQVMDGIVEWRNTWSRRLIPYQRPLNQPVLAHKVACLGRADARIYESWGNVGKCEIVGHPRLDRLAESKVPFRTTPVKGRPLRILVMTARTPGFNKQEIEVSLRSLADLRDNLAKRNDIQVVWRVTKGLHKRLGVKNTFTEATGAELHETLPQMDALITTPSTAMLEGMLFGMPVALLDYHNCPHYVPAAWQILCKDHINPVLEALRTPSLERMLYQEYCLHDALACRTPALPRLVRLIDEMVRIKREHNDACEHDPAHAGELAFPYRILEEPEEHVAWPSRQFDLQALYPNHPVFGNRNVQSLQSELDAAIGTIDQVKEQVNTLTGRLHKIPGYVAASRLAHRVQRYLAIH